MSSHVLEDPTQEEANTASARLRATMAAARLSFNWLGVRKSLSNQQKNQAADSFGAEGKYLSAGKKLLDTSHPAYKAVTAIRGRAVAYWKGVSLPYPEAGIRLIRQDRIQDFDQQIDAFREELEEAVTERLSGDADGHPKVFRDSAVTNLTEFFERFRSLNVRSNEQLDELVERAQEIVRGVRPQQLREDGALRNQITSQLTGVQSSLDGLLVDRPRRRILRKPR